MIVFIYLSSSLESKGIGLNFVVSGLGGANYFVRTNGNSSAYTGWGESYGYEGEVQVIFKKENIGLGLSYGNIYETAVAKNPYTNWVWTREVIRSPLLLKLLLNPLGKINPWVGVGKDNFKISYVELQIRSGDKFRETDLEGTEVFQIFFLGTDISIWKGILTCFEIRYGYNETNNTVKTTNFESLQFLLKVSYRFELSK